MATNIFKLRYSCPGACAGFKLDPRSPNQHQLKQKTRIKTKLVEIPNLLTKCLKYAVAASRCYEVSNAVKPSQAQQ